MAQYHRPVPGNQCPRVPYWALPHRWRRCWLQVGFSSSPQRESHYSPTREVAIGFERRYGDDFLSLNFLDWSHVSQCWVQSSGEAWTRVFPKGGTHTHPHANNKSQNSLSPLGYFEGIDAGGCWRVQASAIVDQELGQVEDHHGKPLGLHSNPLNRDG